MTSARIYNPRCTVCRERETFHFSGVCSTCRPPCKECGRRNYAKLGPICSVCFKAKQRGHTMPQRIEKRRPCSP